MNQVNKHILCLCTMVFFHFVCLSQHFEVQVSKDTAKIGEPIGLFMQIGFNKGMPVKYIEWPILKDTIQEHIEIKEHLGVDTIYRDNITILVKKLAIYSFEEGTHNIPSFNIVINQKDTFSSQEISIFVPTIELTKGNSVYDIFDIIDEEFTWKDRMQIILNFLKENILGILIIISILLILAIIFYRYYLIRKHRVVPEPKVYIPPHILALDELKKLEDKGLWKELGYKPYYIELTIIVRRYLERRYNIQALEQTTKDILKAMKEKQLSKEEKQSMEELLMLSDLVKFAKQEPPAEINQQNFDNVLRFIHLTKEDVNTTTEENV